MWLKSYLFGIICGFCLYTNNFTNAEDNNYFGTLIGALTQLHHGVSGDIYAVDSRTLFIRNFNYDGEGPAAYFYVGNTKKPSNNGAYRIRDERGSNGVLKKYRKKDITLSLPEGKTLRDIKWFSVWCDEFSVNFGDVTIPKNLDFPRPHKINALTGVHGVASDNIVVVDAQTLLIPNFSYDGEAPDAKFWVGNGKKPGSQGTRIPDENGKVTPLRRYDRKTIVLTLPGDLTVFDIGHFGVWCEAFTVDFGHVRMPENVNVPPSLKMLGISPQSKLNCEVLYDDLAYEVRWAVAGESIVVQLVAKLDDGEYMSFGISPDHFHTKMVGADVAVTWVDKESGKGFAQDYYLDAKSQCSGTRGSCPDTRITPNTNSIRLLNAAMVNGYSIVTYQRPLKAADKNDLSIMVNGTQAIVWAIGPLNQRNEVSYHSRCTKNDRYIDFGRQPFWNCPMPDGEKHQTDNDALPDLYKPNSSSEADRRVASNAYLPTKKPEKMKRPATPHPAAKDGAWEIPPIQCYEPEDGVFYAQMGPTGGKHGYPAITGHVGWGISWYINGLLIPEINVVRGRTYTFVVEGGHDPEIPAKYHPFYITDDPVGGYEHKTDEEKSSIQIYAGVQRSRSGVVTPTGTGRICNWTPDPDGSPADEYTSFGAYQRSLTLKCEAGEPAIITWTPDHNTPDTVFYQCFTHRYLGWRINVLDECDVAAESEIVEVFAEPDEEDSEDAFQAESSIRHETKLRPHENLFDNSEKEIKGKIQDDLKNSEISQLITDGIRAAEELELSIASENKFNSTSTALHYNEGEMDEFSLHLTEQRPPYIKDMEVPYDTPVAPTASGLPVFLRPPQTMTNNGPIFRPAKIAPRRPISFERRPLTRPHRPVIIPQPSMIISHYKKPISPLLRPFIKSKPLPIKSIASLLMLGEPTEIPPHNQYFQQQGPYKKNIQKQQKPQRITFAELQALNGKTNNQETKSDLTVIVDGKPYNKPQQYYEKPILSQKSPTRFFDSKSDDEKLAFSAGFQPGSIIVESGFRPILRREDSEESMESGHDISENRRRDDNVSEIDEAIESDDIFTKSEEPNKSFEPMFIPSPLDNVNNLEKIPSNHKKEHLTGDLIDMEVEDGEDKMAVAAERQDTYYLPPDNRNPGQVYPAGTVVAYDGKAVLDISLVNSAPLNIANQNIYADVSRTEQLIRDTPQFVPFRGEIPPLGNDFIQPNNIQFQLNGQSPVTEYLNPLSNIRNNNNGNSGRPISTKLTLLRNDSTSLRLKREAKPHHTPDHHGDEHDHMNSTNQSNSALAYFSYNHITSLTFIFMSISYIFV